MASLGGRKMSGKFIAYVLSVFTFFYLLLISISFLLFMGIRERVNDICYDTVSYTHLTLPTNSLV